MHGNSISPQSDIWSITTETLDTSDSRENQDNDSFEEILLNSLPTDDDIQLKTWLNSLEKDERYEIVNKTLIVNNFFMEDYLQQKVSNQAFESSLCKMQKYAMKYISQINLPLFICAAYKAEKCIQVLLENGADGLATDCNHNNIVHVLIIASSLKADSQNEYTDMYIMLMKKNFTMIEQRKMLLHQENADSLRPVELATIAGTFTILDAIWNTTGVYMFVSGYEGMWTNVLYDVTDYQQEADVKRPATHSLLLMLAFIDEEKFEEDATRTFLQSQFIQEWHKQRFTNIRISVVVSILFRLFYGILFYCSIIGRQLILLDKYNQNSPQNNTVNMTVNMSTVNNTLRHNAREACASKEDEVIVQIFKKGPSSWWHEVIVVTSCYVICIHIFSMCWNLYSNYKYPHMKFLNSKKTMVRYWMFYDNCGLFQGLAFLLGLLLERFDYYSTVYFLYGAATILNIWSVLFVIQLAPYLGWYTVIFQVILGDLAQFIIFLLIIMSSFTGIFFPYLYLNCTKGFQSFYYSFYNTFSIMLNMIPVAAQSEDNTSETPEEIYVLHVFHLLYVLIVAILLINFLIGVMSNSISKIADNREVVMFLQKLWIILTAELLVGPCSCWKTPKGLLKQDGRYYLPIRYYLPSVKRNLVLLFEDEICNLQTFGEAVNDVYY